MNWKFWQKRVGGPPNPRDRKHRKYTWYDVAVLWMKIVNMAMIALIIVAYQIYLLLQVHP